MYRTHAENYKDMVLATCIASTYKYSENDGTDAGSSVTALREWANYDWGISPEKPREFADHYLARDYTTPLVESEIKDVRYDLLKYLDLYHSKELDTQTKKAVINPTHTDVQDYKQPWTANGVTYNESISCNHNRSSRSRNFQRFCIHLNFFT